MDTTDFPTNEALAALAISISPPIIHFADGTTDLIAKRLPFIVVADDKYTPKVMRLLGEPLNENRFKMKVTKTPDKYWALHFYQRTFNGTVKLFSFAVPVEQV